MIILYYTAVIVLNCFHAEFSRETERERGKWNTERERDAYTSPLWGVGILEIVFFINFLLILSTSIFSYQFYL